MALKPDDEFYKKLTELVQRKSDEWDGQYRSMYRRGDYIRGGRWVRRPAEAWPSIPSLEEQQEESRKALDEIRTLVGGVQSEIEKEKSVNTNEAKSAPDPILDPMEVRRNGGHRQIEI